MDFTRPERCRRQRTGREDRHSNFYEVPDNLFSGRVKGTESEVTFDYSQASLIEDGKVARIKEFREHDEAVAWVKNSERGAAPRT
jgi:hypothetical protein